MEIAAIPPATPPPIAPAFDLWRTGVVEDGLELVEELVAEDFGATTAVEGPRIAPGASSGLSFKRSGVRARGDGEGTDKGRGAHHQRDMICWHSKGSHSKVR